MSSKRSKYRPSVRNIAKSELFKSVMSFYSARSLAKSVPSIKSNESILDIMHSTQEFLDKIFDDEKIESPVLKKKSIIKTSTSLSAQMQPGIKFSDEVTNQPDADEITLKHRSISDSDTNVKSNKSLVHEKYLEPSKKPSKLTRTVSSLDQIGMWGQSSQLSKLLGSDEPVLERDPSKRSELPELTTQKVGSSQEGIARIRSSLKRKSARVEPPTYNSSSSSSSGDIDTVYSNYSVGPSTYDLIGDTEEYDKTIEDSKSKELVSAISSTFPLSKSSVVSCRRKTLQFVQDPDYNKTIPFILERSFGINTKAKFFNLTTSPQHPWVFYAVSHVGVLLDYKSMDQAFLLGHKNEVHNIACDINGKWLVTADKGKDDSVIFWNHENVPIFTLHSPHGNFNVEKICLSYDAKYFVSVGNEKNPIIKFWEWTYGNEKPYACYQVEDHTGNPIEISNNINQTNHFMVTFQRKVVFIDWSDGELRKSCPKIRIKKSIGTFTSSTYLYYSTVCATSTDEGCIAIWGNKKFRSPYCPDYNNNDKILIRIIKVQEAPITVIRSLNRLFVTGDANGHIRFYDRKIRIVFWLTRLNFGPITEIGFHRYARKYSYTDIDRNAEAAEIKKYFEGSPSYEDRSTENMKKIEDVISLDATLAKTPFIIRDLIILTSDGQLRYFHFLTNRQEVIIRRQEANVTSMDLHRESPIVCLGFANGKLLTHNYVERTWNIEKYLPDFNFEDNQITSIKFSHKDAHLAVGTSNGAFWFLHPISLEFKTEIPFRSDQKCSPICGIKFSINNDTCIYWDETMGVCFFVHDINEPSGWKFIKIVRAHFKRIVDVIFIPQGHPGEYKKDRLISVGEDRYLVEYDIKNIQDGEIGIVSITLIEQTAIPQCFLCYKTGLDNCNVFVSENKYKFKILSDETFVVKKTILGPIFDSPIKKMSMLCFCPTKYSEYMIFMTEKYIGIHHMPPDGNPFKYVAMVGHPQKLLHYELSYDRSHIATIGKDDNCCLLWKVKADAPCNMEKVGGRELVPFYTLIEGGHSGWLAKEMQDLFYYMQIINQGEDKPDPRRITNKIQLTELPLMMRAVGFYPTEYELDNLMREAKKGHFNENKKVYEITFEEFVRLYINHRPAFGITTECIQNAFFKVLEMPNILKEDFMNLLCEYGESFTPENLTSCLAVLTQPNKEERDEDIDNVPEVITVEVLLKDILGIDMNKVKIAPSQESNFL